MKSLKMNYQEEKISDKSCLNKNQCPVKTGQKGTIMTERSRSMIELRYANNSCRPGVFLLAKSEDAEALRKCAELLMSEDSADLFWLWDGKRCEPVVSSASINKAYRFFLNFLKNLTTDKQAQQSRISESGLSEIEKAAIWIALTSEPVRLSI